MGYATASVFALMYLDLQTNAPKLRYWILFLTGLLSGVFPLLNVINPTFAPTLYEWLFPLSFIYNLSLLLTGTYVWVKGFVYARFYVLGWFFIVSSMFVYIFLLVGIIEKNDFTQNVVYAGFAIEAVFFALALGDRLNQLKKEKKLVVNKNIALIESRNKLLAEQAFINAHLMRAPICRIMGLSNLLRLEVDGKTSLKLIKMIEESTDELDVLTGKISEILEKNGYYDDYEINFGEVKNNIQNELERVKILKK